MIAGSWGAAVLIKGEIDNQSNPFQMWFVASPVGSCSCRVQIVSRRRGFTVETCTAVVPASAESPTFQGLSAGQPV